MRSIPGTGCWNVQGSGGKMGAAEAEAEGSGALEGAGAAGADEPGWWVARGALTGTRAAVGRGGGAGRAGEETPCAQASPADAKARAKSACLWDPADLFISASV